MNGWIEQTAGYWSSGGPLLVPIAIVCFGILGFFLRSRELLARTIRDGAAVKTMLDDRAQNMDIKRMAEMMNAIPGGIAAMVLAVLNDVRRGALPSEAFSACESECLSVLSRDFVILAALTAVAPLLGLLGTVLGMIQTFEAVAATGGDTGARVAAGISQALITTQFGLVVAMPGVFGLVRLRRMLRNAQIIMAECRSYTLQALGQRTEGKKYEACRFE